MKRNKLLTIDPGTLHMGYAAFEDNELVDFGVRDIKQGSPRAILNHVQSVVERMILEKKPAVLVYETNQFSQITQNIRLVEVIARIVSVARKHKVPSIGYNARTIRRIVTGNGNAKKADVAKIVSSRYHQTCHYLKGRNASQQRYFQNTFDAIACGLAHIAETQKQSKRWLDSFLERSGGKR